MKKSIQLLEKGFVSSSVKTPEFKAFARQFKKDLQSHFNPYDIKIVSYNIGHFYVSGFIDIPNKGLYYFSLSDVRDFSPMNSGHYSSLLYRTAKHTKDYTGGTNQYVSLYDGVLGNIVNSMHFYKTI